MSDRTTDTSQGREKWELFDLTLGDDLRNAQGNSLIQTAVQGRHDHGVLDMVVLEMVVLLGDWRFPPHGQTENGMTVAPELNN